MRWILIALLVAGCGPGIKILPASEIKTPKGAQYCASAEIKWGDETISVFVCTPERAMCEKGVKDAKGTPGRLVGVKSVTQCKLIFH